MLRTAVATPRQDPAGPCSNRTSPVRRGHTRPHTRCGAPLGSRCIRGGSQVALQAEKGVSIHFGALMGLEADRRADRRAEAEGGRRADRRAGRSRCVGRQGQGALTHSTPPTSLLFCGAVPLFSHTPRAKLTRTCSQAQGKASTPVRPSLGADPDWLSQNVEAVRAVPLVAGAVGGAATLLNRLTANIPAVADVGSSQARADVLALFLSASLVLSGLSWLSLKPRTPLSVQLEGVPCFRLFPSLPLHAASELRWAWDTLSFSTTCRSLVVVYKAQCMLQAGLMASTHTTLSSTAAPPPTSTTSHGTGPSIPPPPAVAVDAKALCGSSIGTMTTKSGKANYLANLALFPARFDLLQFLPINTQSAILVPLGDGDGLMVLGSDTVRGFTPLDQAWIASIAEKLDSSLGSVASSS